MTTVGKLFDHYDVRTLQLGSDVAVHRRWFAEYARRNYLPQLSDFTPADARVVEIGCSTGLLLAVLRDAGFTRLEGIDLSPGDIGDELGKSILISHSSAPMRFPTFLIDPRRTTSSL